MIFSIALAAFSHDALSQMVNQWRGPARDGHYSAQNLLNEWPADGPVISWVFEGLGGGYSSPVILNGKIYVSGMEQGEGYVYVLNMDGSLDRKINYGPERSSDFPGSRVSPTIAGDQMYIASAYGKLLCYDLNTGRSLWQKDLFKDFDGGNIQWGYTENLIIDGHIIYCSPGGSRNNVVALNRHSGDLIWSSPGRGDLSAYCSPLLFEHGGRKILATHMANNIVGFDAATGQLLWSHPFVNEWAVHPNTPIYADGGIFFFSGYGRGGIKFMLNHDGSAITKAWETTTFDVQIEGAVWIDGFLYGAGQNNRFWFCVDWKTGENKWQARNIARGSALYADGKLYIYTERGELALVRPSPDEFKLLSQTRVRHGSEQHWAHPVLHNGVLYVRHGNALIAYQVK